MKQVLIIIPLAAAAATSACVPATYGPGLAAMPPYAYRPPVYGAGVPVASLPVARWENVMMLPGRASIDVLTADGRRTSAAFVSATNTILRVRAGSSEIDIAAGSVVRIDRWFGGAAGSESVARDAARGAAVGAAAIGVLGLLAGHAPPARVFAAGAIVGAYDNAERGRVLRRSVVVYLAPPAAAPARRE